MNPRLLAVCFAVGVLVGLSGVLDTGCGPCPEILPADGTYEVVSSSTGQPNGGMLQVKHAPGDNGWYTSLLILRYEVDGRPVRATWRSQ